MVILTLSPGHIRIHFSPLSLEHYSNLTKQKNKHTRGTISRLLNMEERKATNCARALSKKYERIVLLYAEKLEKIAAVAT